MSLPFQVLVYDNSELARYFPVEDKFIFSSLILKFKCLVMILCLV